MKKDDLVYLRHILDATRRIWEYMQGVERPGFAENQLLQDGVIRQLEVVGEATKRVSAEVKGRHPNIPWKDVAGMRDKLIHDYFGVDLDAVWDTATKDVPKLRDAIENVVKHLSPSD
jgi:uncharacterized protein with HEPN domain